MKKGFKWIGMLAGIMVFVLIAAGCSNSTTGGNNSSSENGEQSSQNTITVGISYQALSDEFTVRLADSFEARAKELGIKVIRADGQMNAEKQVGQIENFIAQKVDVIVLNPVSVDGAVPAVEAAVDAGIPIINFLTKTNNQELATSYVGSDIVSSGVMQGDMVKEDLNGKGNIVVMLGQMGHDGQIGRSEGLKQAFEGTDIEVIAEQTANWNREEGMALMENWLSSGKQIDAVLGQNDAMALGALMAIKERGLEGKILVYGIDAQSEALDAVEAGEMAGTILQNAEEIASKTAEVAFDVASGKEVDKVYEVPYEPIRAADVPNYRK